MLQVHVAVLIEDHAVKVATTHPIIIVSAIDPDACPVVRQVNPKLAFVDLGTLDGHREPFEIGPCRIFGLHIERRYVSKSAILALECRRPGQQVHHTCHRLASAPMSHETRPTLAPLMERIELLSRPIANVNDSILLAIDRLSLHFPLAVERPCSRAAGAGCRHRWRVSVLACPRHDQVFPCTQPPGLARLWLWS